MSKTMEKGTENAIFLDGRDYTAADLYRLIGLLVGNGVYMNELAPTATNENMSITHGTGHAWIGGVAYWNTMPFIVDVPTADGSLNRYDSLMLRRDLSNNEVYAILVQGDFATNPTPPACTRNAEIFDLKICDVYVPAGCTKITQDQITDTRLDSSVCGVPVFPVEHMDMTSFYRQIATDLANFQQKQETDFAGWEEEQKESNLATMAALVEVVRNASDESRDEILNLLAQLNNLVESDIVGELIAEINNKLSLDGSNKMTGPINMNGHPVTGLNSPTNDDEAANKAYTDTKLPRAGGDMTGAIDMNGNGIHNLPEPIDSGDAVPKSYIDAKLTESPDHPGCYYRTVDGVVEWINPPMVPGVEYRTTEKWNGKDIYTKLIDFGALPNTSSKTVDIGVGLTIVSLSGVTISTGGYRFALDMMPGVTELYYNSTAGWLGVTTTTDRSTYTRTYIRIKYTLD